jgi:Cu(I)/Ag(I) efflux system membrane fusion protein
VPRRRALRAVVKVIELRLRFIALMAGTALAFGSWDTLVNRFETWNRPPGAAPAPEGRFEFYCPMHPSVVGGPSSHCPSCGMPLSRRERGAAVALPEGVLSRVCLSPGRVAQAGIRTVAVGFAAPADRLTTVGLVGFDEGRRVLVASDARGRLRVERLHVSSEGVPVRAGQRLAELYGYDVAQAVRVFFEAREARLAPPGSSGDLGRTPLGDPEERVRLAVRGLKVLGVRQEQIDALAGGEGDGPGELLPLLAPISGHVIRKVVHEGQYVSEGAVLFEVADLSRVWVEARVFEDQLGRVAVGRPVEAAVPAFPGAVFRGFVTLVAPGLDPASRTAAVRFELDNRDHRLRPGMSATVTLSVAPDARTPREQTTCPVTGLRLGSMGPAVPVEVGGRTVRVCCGWCGPKLKASPDEYLARLGALSGEGVPIIPEPAVIDTGTSQVVYVESEPGVFEGRAVTLGPRSGDHYPVLDGLAPGERVAAAGAFLVDAETRLNPSARAAPPVGKGTPRSPSGTPHRSPISDK